MLGISMSDFKASSIPVGSGFIISTPSLVINSKKSLKAMHRKFKVRRLSWGVGYNQPPFWHQAVLAHEEQEECLESSTKVSS